MLHLPVYMDNNATTRVDPRVVEAMLPYFTERYGNAASRHHVFGRDAEAAVETARAQVAELIGAGPRDIVFTSGATESDNLAIKGAARIRRSLAHGEHLIITDTEHHAVIDPAKRLALDGFSLTYLPVDRFGRVTAEQLAAALTPRTTLVSIMAANNEIGTLQPIAEMGRLCKERKVLFHTDAVQAAGKLPLDVEQMGIDLLSLSAHKMYGPKGIGALYVRRRSPHVRLEPIMDGGGHERGLRSGTLAVPLIVGLGEACRLCQEEMAEESQRLAKLRERLRQGIMEKLGGVSLNGHPTDRLPGNLNLSFTGVRGDALLMSLKNLAVSSGSACTSANPEPSYVLRAIGLTDELAQSSLRFGLGRFTTEEEVDFAISEVIREVNRLRALNPEHALTAPISTKS
jgi:cysteine desulfurase